MGTPPAPPSEESRLTVVLALLANAAVAVLKVVAGLLTGSGALLSEAAHSAGDTSTELLLLTALNRSGRQADRRHPFGYGKERYFWSLLAAMAIFVSGAIFSAYQGVRTIVDEPAQRMAWVNYLVLVLAAILEGTSLRQGVKQARGAAREGSRSFVAYLRDPEDPTVKSVVLEDSVALIGLALAAAGVALHQVTGSAVYDGCASIAIALLLVVASIALAQTCKGLLIGRQADPRLVRTIVEEMRAEPEVDAVVDILTMLLGTNRVLVCCRVDFGDRYDAADLEQACVRIGSDLRERYPILDEIFIEPVPRKDQGTRARVLERYGHLFTD